MTTPARFPDPHDKDAVRQWMREHGRRGADRMGPESPAEFAALQRRRLLERLGAPESRSPRTLLDVALTGAPTEQHTVGISVLGSFLVNLQESISAIAQARTGRPTRHAPIPRTIRDITALSAAAVFPSSFGLTLRGPEGDGDLFTGVSGSPATILEDAVDVVFEVAELSEGAGRSDDLLAEHLVPLGQRAMKHLGALAAGLADDGLGLRMSWQGRGGRTRRSEWTREGAQRVRALCEQSDFGEPETTTIVGWLGSASELRGTVEIRTDAGEIIRARTDAEVTAQLRGCFGNRVEADLEVATVRSAGGRERKVYVVLALRNA